MLNKQIAIVIYIITYLQVIYTYDINSKLLYTYENITNCEKKEDFIYIYDKSKIASKSDVLKQTDILFTSYYCKNDVCVLVDYEYKKPFIEIPDENGNVTLYNTYTCTYDKAKSGNCISTIYIGDLSLSVECTADSQCLSNKCIDNYCVFNDETPIVHCDDIYTGKRNSYMHCGKPYHEPCKTDDECSSKKCSTDGTCSMQREGPSESINIDSIIFVFLTLIIII
eukprot:jgi/Orpsp1_1/1188552/evm.model.d7180000065679.1